MYCASTLTCIRGSVPGAAGGVFCAPPFVGFVMKKPCSIRLRSIGRLAITGLDGEQGCLVDREGLGDPAPDVISKALGAKWRSIWPNDLDRLDSAVHGAAA